jgi:hypothetical protein
MKNKMMILNFLFNIQIDDLIIKINRMIMNAVLTKQLFYAIVMI